VVAKWQDTASVVDGVFWAGAELCRLSLLLPVLFIAICDTKLDLSLSPQA
jgi:hypothetical protein